MKEDYIDVLCFTGHKGLDGTARELVESALEKV